MPDNWHVEPWVFIPQNRHALLKSKLKEIIVTDCGDEHMPAPRVTYLEAVTPWNYVTWDRQTDAVESDD